jgi:DNA-binding response OmpR family regulator
MANCALKGRSILVIEHDSDVALRLGRQFGLSGAKVFAAANLRDAQHMAEHPALSAVVIGLRIGRDETTSLCRRLSHLGIPFMFHTSFDPSDARQMWPDAPILSKPSATRVVAQELVDMLNRANNRPVSR